MFLRERMPPIPKNQLIHIRLWKRMVSSAFYIAATAMRVAALIRKADPRKVLVLEPVGLGDMVSFEPLVREMLRRGYEVAICSRPEWRPLFPDRPGQSWIDLRMPWALSYSKKVKYQPGLYLSEPTRGDLKRLRGAAQGATGIDTRGDIRSVILLYWAGCRRVISLSNYLGSDLPMWRTAAETVPFDNDVRRWELNVQFLKALDASFDPRQVAPPELPHLLEEAPRQRIGLMPVAPWEGKLWPPERWQRLLAELQKRGWEPIGLCGPNQRAQMQEHLGNEVPFAECGSVEGWAREFNQCAFVITLDSGPMHLADALGIPVIALYGQGKLPLWAPSGKNSVAIGHQNTPDFFVCHPVAENIPLAQSFMKRITVEEVLEAVFHVEKAIREERRVLVS